MHLANAFIQSDLHCKNCYQFLLSMGIKPMTLVLLVSRSTVW